MAKSEQKTATDEAKPQRPGWSKAELDFIDALEALDVKLEAFIYRPHVNWLPVMYGYRLTHPNGWQKSGFISWDDQTFATVLAAAKKV